MTNDTMTVGAGAIEPAGRSPRVANVKSAAVAAPRARSSGGGWRAAAAFPVVFAAALLVLWPEFAAIGFADIWTAFFRTIGLASIATEASSHVAEFVLMAYGSLKLSVRWPVLALLAGALALFLRFGV